jgi:hypothetical protein
VTPPRDRTISFALPTVLAEVEPTFGSELGHTVSVLVSPDGYRQAIGEFRRVIEVLEHFAWLTAREASAWP